MNSDRTKVSTQLHDQWTQLVERVEWDHFHTLTFSPTRFPHGMSLEQGLQRFREFANALGGMLFDAVPWFAVAEQTEAELPHVHALTEGTEGLNLEAMRARWRDRNGRVTKIERYDPHRPAGRYVTKMADGEEFQWETSNAADELLREHS